MAPATYSGSTLAVLVILLTLGSALPLSMLFRTKWWVKYYRNQWLWRRLHDDVDDASMESGIRGMGVLALVVIVGMLVASLVSFFPT